MQLGENKKQYILVKLMKNIDQLIAIKPHYFQYD